MRLHRRDHGLSFEPAETEAPVLQRQAGIPILHARECQASAETAVRHQPKLCKASAEDDLSPISRTRTQNLEPKNLEPTAGFEPATRCLQIRIFAVRSVSSSANKCHFVFGSRKFRADWYRQVLRGGESSGGIFGGTGRETVGLPARARICTGAAHTNLKQRGAC